MNTKVEESFLTGLRRTIEELERLSVADPDRAKALLYGAWDKIANSYLEHTKDLTALENDENCWYLMVSFAVLDLYFKNAGDWGSMLRILREMESGGVFTRAVRNGRACNG